jgi:hypothetical protein
MARPNHPSTDPTSIDEGLLVLALLRSSCRHRVRPIIGVDRKCAGKSQNGAFDPKPTIRMTAAATVDHAWRVGRLKDQAAQSNDGEKENESRECTDQNSVYADFAVRQSSIGSKPKRIDYRICGITINRPPDRRGSNHLPANRPITCSTPNIASPISQRLQNGKIASLIDADNLKASCWLPNSQCDWPIRLLLLAPMAKFGLLHIWSADRGRPEVTWRHSNRRC